MPKVKRMEASVTCEAWLSQNHAPLWEINGRTGDLVRCTYVADYEVHDVLACEYHLTSLVRHMGDAFMNGTCAVRVVNPSNALDDGENPLQLTDGMDVWEHVGSGFYVFVFRTGKRGMPTERRYLERFNDKIRPVVGPPLHWVDCHLVPVTQ